MAKNTYLNVSRDVIMVVFTCLLMEKIYASMIKSRNTFKMYF